MGVGQDIDGRVLFPEDNYGAGEYQEDGPQPEDKVNCIKCILTTVVLKKMNERLSFQRNCGSVLVRN